MLVAVPQYVDLPENDGTRCFVKVNYLEMDSFFRKDEKPPGVVSLDAGAGVLKEIRDFAAEFIGHLCACLRLQFAESDTE
jgi:hypothetical protein